MKCLRPLAAIAAGPCAGLRAASGFGISAQARSLGREADGLVRADELRRQPVVIQGAAMAPGTGPRRLGDTRIPGQPGDRPAQPGESQVVQVALRARPTANADRVPDALHRGAAGGRPRRPTRRSGVRLVQRMDLPSSSLLRWRGEEIARCPQASVEVQTCGCWLGDGTGHWRLGDLVVADAGTSSVNPLVISASCPAAASRGDPLRNGAIPAAVTVKGDAAGEAFEAGSRSEDR